MNPSALTALLTELLLLLALPPPASQQEAGRQCAAGESCAAPDGGRSLPDDFVDPCRDTDGRCPEWAAQGECKGNPGYMLPSCARSCGLCSPVGGARQPDPDPGGGLCRDDFEQCGEWAAGGECSVNPRFMQARCKSSCWKCVNAERDRRMGVAEDIIARKTLHFGMDTGADQLVRGVSDGGAGGDPMTAEDAEGVLSTIRGMDHYARYAMTDPSADAKARERCRNNFRMCAEWASRGLCLPAGLRNVEDDGGAPREVGEGEAHDVIYMMDQCPLACRACGELDSLHRCAGRRHPRAEPSFASGARLSAFLEGKRDGDGGDWGRYEPVFASHPGAGEEGLPGDDPHVIVLRRFLSDGEADRLLRLGSSLDWSSGLARCHNNDRCADDATYRGIMRRISSLVGVAGSHLEPMEIVGLHHGAPHAGGKVHHNFERSGLWKPAGPRVLSLFLFLSNAGGGGLGFPRLDWLMIHPKKGTAVLWSNARGDGLMEPEPRSAYEHLPPGDEQTILWGASVHVMLHNWTDANIRGCA